MTKHFRGPFEEPFSDPRLCWRSLIVSVLCIRGFMRHRPWDDQSLFKPDCRSNLFAGIGVVGTVLDGF
jgi:hypothetical protein